MRKNNLLQIPINKRNVNLKSGFRMNRKTFKKHSKFLKKISNC